MAPIDSPPTNTWSQRSDRRFSAISTLSYQSCQVVLVSCFERAAVAGQLRAVDGVAGAGQAVGDVAQLDRCAAQAVDEQKAGLAAVVIDAAIFCRRCRDAVGLD